MIALTEQPGGFILAVKVVPGASRDRIAGEYADGIKVTVRKAAQAGEANRAVVELLAVTLQIAPANVRIVRGAASPRKQVMIAGLSSQELGERLRNIISNCAPAKKPGM